MSEDLSMDALLPSDSSDADIATRFRKFLPVIVDVETGGFNSKTDALLEIAAVLVRMDSQGTLRRGETLSFQIEPFEGANIEKAALDFTGINLDCEFRNATDEELALKEIFRLVRDEIRDQACNRAILVGHNAHFDLGFLHAATDRNKIKRNPFHPFSCFDTATLSGLAFGQTVLAKACETAGIEFSNKNAHAAAYDAEKTADLFCTIVNKWKGFGGWPV